MHRYATSGAEHGGLISPLHLPRGVLAGQRGVAIPHAPRMREVLKNRGKRPAEAAEPTFASTASVPRVLRITHEQK